MTTEVVDVRNLPTDKDGIPIPLTQSLTPPDLKAHRAGLGMLCEFLSRKHDRFGWDRMSKQLRGEIIRDFLAALQNYPMDEVREAARECEADNPNRMPNEQHIRAKIIAKRGRISAMARARRVEEQEPRQAADQEAAREIMERAGFTPQRFAAVKHRPMATSAADLALPDAGQKMRREEYMTPEEIAREDGDV